MKPKESAECYQILSLRVASGHETNIYGGVYHCASWHVRFCKFQMWVYDIEFGFQIEFLDFKLNSGYQRFDCSLSV